MKPDRLLSRVRKLAAGARKHLVPGKPLSVAGAPHDQGSILSRLEAVLAANKAVADARNAVTHAIAAREKLHAAARPFVEDLKASLTAHFGTTNPILSEFGVPVSRRRRQLTSEEKAIASAEGVRTRRARGSYTSQKQRAQITLAGRPGLSLVDPQGNVKLVLPPAPPGKPRPKK
jgi:hypothetical protein